MNDSDLAQEGKAEQQQWVPQPQAPVVMFDNVGKTYGRYQNVEGFRSPSVVV